VAFCIPKKDAAKFLAALGSGDINVAQLMDMTSAERRAHFAKVVGENVAEGMNAAFEAKMLLKDQRRGMVTWARSMAGLKDKVKLDFISKVNKLERVLEPAEERAFLADLAAQKLGATVTLDEAKAISEGAKTVTDLQKAWDPATQQWASEADRLKYGVAYVTYQEYVGALLRDANTKNFKEWLTQPKLGAVLDIANSTKGIVASLDNSFFGRQGIKVLFTNPDIWAAGFAKSFVDIGKTIGGHDPMLPLKAEIYSRPNSMNGKYRNGKFALGQDVEEAFPTSIPERIPGFGRLYKASENAFVGGALRLRADLADRVIRDAEAYGVDMSVSGPQAEAIGDLINSMTGRGNIGRMSGEWVNATFFSIRFLKANWDTLTMHTFGAGIEPGPGRDFMRKRAATNLLKIATSMALIYAIAGMLWPDSVEWDPRSSNFGKIKIGNTRFDISGGMASMVTLAARLMPTMHNGRWGWWSKSAVSGRWSQLGTGKFGSKNPLDVLEDFIEGKASPFAGKVLTVLRGGRDFTGERVTLTGEALSLVTPIGFSTMQDAMKDPNAAPLLAVYLLDAMGIGASTYSGKKEPRAREIWDEEFWSQPGQSDDQQVAQ